jgi:small subunit ribosomal protein S7
MARRRVAEKRQGLPDPKFHDILVTKFINVLMLCGKKSVAERIFYGALEVVSERSRQEPLSVFKRAMDNVKPVLEVKSRRVGGSTYQVPVEVRPDRRQALSARWIVQAAKSRSERTMRMRLA